MEIVDVVTFDANGGTVSEASRKVKHNTAIGALPVPTYTGYLFDGWFTSPTGGIQVQYSDIIDHDIPLYAHWTDASTIVIAKIGNTDYQSLQDAVDAATSSETTITLMRNRIENITIASGKNIVLDLQNYTLSNETAYSVITNYGKLKIMNGTISTDSATAAAVNNNNSNARLTITGGTIVAYGLRQALYNDKGTVEISGTAYLSASSPERAAVQNQPSSTMTIKGGTIVSSGFSAVDNRGTLTIGTNDGTISSSTPVMQGINYGITATSNYKFFDGVAKGKVGSFDRTPSEIESGAQKVDTTETINGDTYQVTYYN